MPHPSKEHFFRHHLVPCAQLLTVFLDLYGKHAPRNYRTTAPHDTFELLHIAAVYAINPENSDLKGVEEAVESFMRLLKAKLVFTGQQRTRQLATALRGQCPSKMLPLAEKTAVARWFCETAVPAVRAQLYSAVGFASAQHQAWFRAQMHVPTPLTTGGRAGRWRTLVRNGSWERAIDLLGIGDFVSTKEVKFGHPVGRDHAQRLWAEAFPEGLENPAQATLSAKPEALKLPHNTTVTSVGGLLRVTTVFEPKSFLRGDYASRVKALKAKVPESVKKLLQARTLEQTCGVNDLVDAVQTAQTWLAEQTANTAGIDAYHRWVDEAELKALTDRFEQCFSAEERVRLVKAYSGA